MSKFISLQILGYSGGIPTKDRITSCVVISKSDENIMIDCGEGAYRKYIQNNYKLSMLKNIFISHMHPDHVGGIVPLLYYKSISNNHEKISIFGPKDLKSFIDQSLSSQKIELKYKYNFYAVENSNYKKINDLKIDWIKLDHKIPSWGYSFNNGEKKIVFITDTRVCANSFKFIDCSDILIHESTFSDNQKDLAYNKFHSIPNEVISMAKKSGVKRLFLTHFSPNLSNDYLENIFYNEKKCVIFNERFYF